MFVLVCFGLVWFGLFQHHDAISGTEKQHVADDYAKQIDQGIAACNGITEQLTPQLLQKRSSPSGATFTHDAHAVDGLSENSPVAVVLQNPLAWKRSEFVSIYLNR